MLKLFFELCFIFTYNVRIEKREFMANNQNNSNHKNNQSTKTQNNNKQSATKHNQSYKEKYNQYKKTPQQQNQQKTTQYKKNKQKKTSTKLKQYGAVAIVAIGMAGTAIYDKVVPGSFTGQHTQQQSNNKNNQSSHKNTTYIERDYNKEQPPFDHSNDGTYMGENPGETNNGKTTFTSSELAFTKSGWIKYGNLDKLGRPTAAEAVINKELVDQKNGTSANRDIRPPGFKTGNEPYGHSRGHLIGKQFGGDGNDKRNLVTLFQEPVNSPLMTDYENYVRWAVSYKRETVRFRVTPIYQGKNVIPVAVKMEAQSMGNDQSINFNVTIPNIK